MRSNKSAKAFFVYKITNTVNGKGYVGITSVSPESRFRDHIKRAKEYKDRQVFAAAICKYGAKSFVIETLEVVDSWEDAQEMEKAYISELNTHINEGNGYNMTLGGDGSYGRVIKVKGVSVSKKAEEIKPFSVRLTPTEKDMVSALAKTKQMSASMFFKHLLNRAIEEYDKTGEVIALSKY